MFNFKLFLQSNPTLRALSVFILLFQLHCWGVAIDDREKRLSGIQPAPLLLPNKEKITLTSPIHGVTLTGLGTGSHDFIFDTSQVRYAALYIFDSEPHADATKSFVVNMANICQGGATNLASHIWSDTSLKLDYRDSFTQLYRCTSRKVDLLSENLKLRFDSSFFTPGVTYYWAIIGYDRNFMVTHASAIRSFTVSP